MCINSRLTTMKKTFIVLAAMLVTSIAAKAWEVGDFYDQDPTGVPAVVVYVDESGEHGLIMSPRALTEKEYAKAEKEIYKGKKMWDKWLPKFKKQAVKKGVEDQTIELEVVNSEKLFNALINYLPNAPRRFDGKLKEQEERKMIENIAAENTEFGESNQQAIISYCQANDIDIAMYFKNIDWAMQLGVGWFIPGNKELELFNAYFADGIGKKNKLDYKELDIRQQPYQLKVGVLNGAWGFWMYPYYNILSSTALKSAWEETDNNTEKTGVIKTQNGSLWELADKDNYYALAQAFNNKYYYIFAKNWQENSVVVAFKRF